MEFRPTQLRFSAWLLSASLLVATALGQSKRPLNHHDYDGWRAISLERISNDGKFLAYAVFPQDGDGEVIIRNLVTGKDQHEPAGGRPVPVAAGTGEEEGPPVARNISLAFSDDSRTLAFSTFPSKADVEKARKEKKTGDQAPKDGLVIVDLASGKTARLDHVRRFAMPERASGYLVYQRESQARPAGAAPEGNQDQQGGRGTAGTGGSGRGGARSEFGSEVVVRSLADGSEHAIEDIVEFSLTHDGKQLVYTVGARDTSKNGVFAVKLGSAEPSMSLLSGKGKYQHLTWDENQTQLIFLSDKDDAAAKQPKWKLYRWERQSQAAAELASADTQGFKKEYVISGRGPLSFSKDGTRVLFAVASPRPERAEAAAGETDEKASVDLWSYKDDYINPIQKIRAERDRNRTFSAAYLIPEKRVVQLTDNTMESISASESAQWMLGTDDRAYRVMADYDERYSDAYIVDAGTGARKLVAQKQRGTLSWSPNGRYLLAFNGKDWECIEVPGGKSFNLTAALPVNFWNEETDTPSTPAAYGAANWTKDGKTILLYDKYDVWRISPDGSGAKNVTAGYGRSHEIRFRMVRQEDDPREHWIDPGKAPLLSATNLKTFESGFYRGNMDGAEPKPLIMAAKSYSTPVKARDADVYLLTEQSFSEFPDLVTTDGAFKELRKVSSVNPQKSQINWGASEVVAFKNSDGVALTAALYKPENFDPSKKYPMLVYIYEKLTQNVNRFVDPRPMHSINISYYVSNGYLVLTPDIVYTTGYPGQSALKCVLPAIQAVVDKGYVNEKAIGIQGHSWGGYQIAYMVTQTNRFRAVAAGAPVADMISAYDGIRWGTGIPRQFQYERTQSRIGGSIWRYPTRFIENSPIFWADRVQTPVMILHNDADTAVPWYQGIEYYLALRRLGKEVYMFVYNGEPHGLTKRPNQKDYTIRLQQYFDHFLKGASTPDWMEKGVPFIEKEKTALSTLGAGQ